MSVMFLANTEMFTCFLRPSVPESKVLGCEGVFAFYNLLYNSILILIRFDFILGAAFWECSKGWVKSTRTYLDILGRLGPCICHCQWLRVVCQCKDIPEKQVQSPGALLSKNCHDRHHFRVTAFYGDSSVNYIFQFHRKSVKGWRWRTELRQ